MAEVATYKIVTARRYLSTLLLRSGSDRSAGARWARSPRPTCSTSSTNWPPPGRPAPWAGPTACCGPCSTSPPIATTSVVLPAGASTSPKPTKSKVHVFSPDELVALASAMPADYGPMVWIGALLGLRWGETAALRVRSIDFLRRTIRIDEQRTRERGGPEEFGPPKSDAGTRSLAAPDPLLRLIADHLSRQGLGAGTPDALLFTAPQGGALDYSAWRRRVWCPAIAKAGCGTFERMPASGGHTRDMFHGPGFHDYPDPRVIPSSEREALPHNVIGLLMSA